MGMENDHNSIELLLLLMVVFVSQKPHATGAVRVGSTKQKLVAVLDGSLKDIRFINIPAEIPKIPSIPFNP